MIEVACVRCGQEEGPFAGIREAERILAYYGWNYSPPIEAWDGGCWAPGHQWSFYCALCWLQRCRDLKERHPRPNVLSNALDYQFVVSCSRGHKKAKTLHTGTLHVSMAGPVIEWTTSYLGPPRLGEPKPDGERKVTLRCPSCRLDRQMRAGLLTEALQALVVAGAGKDRFYRMILDIALIPC